MAWPLTVWVTESKLFDLSEPWDVCQMKIFEVYLEESIQFCLTFTCLIIFLSHSISIKTTHPGTKSSVKSQLTTDFIYLLYYLFITYFIS